METMEVDGEAANNAESQIVPTGTTSTTTPTILTVEPMEEGSGIINANENQEKNDPSGSIKSQPKKESSNVMADPSTVPSVTISLHPLVIMNISEHWTRLRAQAGEFLQVYGALIGKQKGRNIEIMNSFELKIDYIGSDLIVNRDYYSTKENQYKQVNEII